MYTADKIGLYRSPNGAPVSVSHDNFVVASTFAAADHLLATKARAVQHAAQPPLLKARGPIRAHIRHRNRTRANRSWSRR